MMMLRYHLYEFADRFRQWREARKAQKRMNAFLRRSRFVQTASGRWEQR